MPRPVTRTRIISAGAGAAVSVAALAFALNPPTQVDPLGTLGRANALAPAAVPEAVAPPVAFGVDGVDLRALGYHGPDPAAVTLGSLSKPFPALPTERAADIRDRIARATPHLQSLHQAKILLGRSLPRHDDHVRAAKRAVAVALAEQEAAEVELADVRARIEQARTDTPDEGGPDQRPSEAVDPAPPGADAGGGPGGNRPEGAGDAGREGRPDTPGGEAGRGEGGGPEAEAPDEGEGNGKGKGKGAPKDPKPGKPADAGTGVAPGKAGGKGATSTDTGKPAKGAGSSASAPRGVQLASSGPSADAPAPAVAPAEPVVQSSDLDVQLDVPVQVDSPVSPAAQVGKLVVLARAETAVERAEEAHVAAVADLDARRQRREAHRAATAAAEHEVWRLDAHVRWLQNELWLAQRQMPSAGNWLVLEERKDPAESQIVEVRGFRVHKSLEHSVRQLVDEAAAAGIDLKGKAYRPVSRQIELRRQNCGTSQYDIYEKPSSLCSPPTAKPGRSLHEMGLALDFRNGTNGITSRRDPAFQWLARHAPSYGLYNLPAEPWHWSVTGQ